MILCGGLGLCRDEAVERRHARRHVLHGHADLGHEPIDVFLVVHDVPHDVVRVRHRRVHDAAPRARHGSMRAPLLHVGLEGVAGQELVAPDVPTEDLVVFLAEVVVELVKGDVLAADAARAIMAARGKMLLLLDNAVHATAQARRCAVRALFPRVPVDVVLCPHNVAAFFRVETGVVGALVHRHVHIILGVEIIGAPEGPGVDRRGAQEALAGTHPLRGRFVELEVVARAHHAHQRRVVAGGLALLRLARETLEANGDADLLDTDRARFRHGFCFHG